MKLLFMGTSDFAQACLRRVLEEGWEVCAVCTKPDRPSRRGMKFSACPVMLPLAAFASSSTGSAFVTGV